MSEDWPGQPEQTGEAWPGQPEPAAPAQMDTDVAKGVYPLVGPAIAAFQGAKDGWGSEPIGLSPESVKWLSEKKIFGPEKGGYDNPFQAFNEMLAHTIVGAVDIAGRAGSAALGAYQAGVAAVGDEPGADQKFWRDMAAMPEAFFGTPHPMGIPKRLPAEARLLPSEIPTANLIEGYHGSPTPFTEFSEKGPYYFTPDANAASQYAVTSQADTAAIMRGDKDFVPSEKSPHVVPAFLQMDRPYKVDMWDLENATNARDPNWLKENGYDSAILEDKRDPSGTEFIVLNRDQIKPRYSLPDLVFQARDLGVIGPPKPDITDLPPAEKAAAEVPPPARAAATARGDSISEPVGGPEKAGNIRLDQIGINADAKEVILDAAKNNDDFNQARQGGVPLAQVESLSNASGVPSALLTQNDGLGRLMHNDAVVRTWLQAFHQATDEIAEQMQTVARTGDETDIEKLRDMKLRFQHMQEQVSGLTAEAGRTLRVFRDFYENKGKAEAIGKVLEDNPGLDADSLKKLADAGKGLDDPAKVARLLHDSNQPTFWDKYLYYWVNALISGPVTHLKYIGANAAFGAYEAGVVTPVAGALGTVRRLAGGTDGVYVGEAAARTWGLLAGTPDALRASWQAAKNNVMTPFPNEVAGAAVNPLTQVRPSPIGGKLGFALGIPGRSAAGIHSFFRWLGYRAEIEAQAYRQAAKEGLSPAGQDFWERRATLADNPTEEMMNAGIENGNHLTFIGEQGKFGKLMNTVSNWSPTGQGGFQPFKLIMPFTHIPGQILRAGLEQTPAAFLDSTMRADILGKNGAVAADTARARLIAGGAVSAMVANWAVNDTLTGYGPTDPTERAAWLRTHEPYSVRLGGWWYSYNKFGPIGDLIGVVANLVEVGPKVAEGEYAAAAGKVVKATSRMLEDEVGMQGLVNLIEAQSDPDNKMGRFLSSQAATNMPYSSLLRQTASFNDPVMREAKTFVDQLRYATPWSRQDLLPKRDWLGVPMDNPGYHSILRQRPQNNDPVELAVLQLPGFKPAPPQAHIGGVKLPPKMYDEYQATAGAMTRAGLEPVVTAPGWGEMPLGVRSEIVHHIIESARKTAGSMMQAKHPELIMKGISNRQDKINGTKPTKLTD
jgi:hypothetical protein